MSGGNESQDLVNIVVTSFNRLESTVLCLESIKRFTSIPYRLTVVDDGSLDKTPMYLKNLKKRGEIDNLFLFRKNMGVAVACNMGLCAEDTPFSLKMDNDNRAKHPDWLTRLVDKARQDASIGAVAYDIYNNNREGEVDRCGGSVMLIPRHARRTVGYFNEEYAPYGEEDSDFSLRIKLSGLKNHYLKPGLSVEHDDKHRSYGSADRDRVRSREYRRENLYSAYFNSMLYHNSLRPLFVTRRYVPSIDDEGYVVFEEDQAYREFLTRNAPAKYEYIESIRHAIEPYINNSP
jgi:GT2 family glycosyltransferase